MKEKNKKLLITCLVIVLPMLAGLMLWKLLPDQVATHFGSDNRPNRWDSKEFAVLGLPLMMLGLHLLAVFACIYDPRRRNVSPVMVNLLYWVMPVVCNVVMLSIYGYALNMPINIGMIANLLVGGLFIALGNYLPKNQQNFTVGVRVRWTFTSEENWRRTNCLAGKMFVICGVIFLVNAFIQSAAVLLLCLVLCMVVPAFYSLYLYKKGV